MIPLMVSNRFFFLHAVTKRLVSRLVITLIIGLMTVGLYYGAKDFFTPLGYSPPSYVNVYNWYGMIPADILKEFESETGITVRYDLYDSNELVEAKLLAGNSGYDVIFPSVSPYVVRQIEARLCEPLDHALIPNMVHVDERVTDKMKDLDARLPLYSVPYYWGTFGIAYVEEIVNARLPNAPVDSYQLLFDPEIVRIFKEDGVSLLEEAVDVYPAVLAYLGKNPQSDDRQDLRIAQETLLSVRPYIKRFSSSRFMYELAGGETCIAQAWSGEAQLAQKLAEAAGKNIHIRYVLPKEGGLLWIDAMVIPRGAPHRKNAHRFIDFLLRPDISARIANAIQLAIANKTAWSLIDDDIRYNQTIYPNEKTLAHFHLDKAQSHAYERGRSQYWNQVRLGQTDPSLSFTPSAGAVS